MRAPAGPRGQQQSTATRAQHRHPKNVRTPFSALTRGARFCLYLRAQVDAFVRAGGAASDSPFLGHLYFPPPKKHLAGQPVDTHQGFAHQASLQALSAPVGGQRRRGKAARTAGGGRDDLDDDTAVLRVGDETRGGQ